MAKNGKKPWDRALSTQEIIQNAPNWSLAEDVGLLKHLEEFSENLLGKAEETNTHLNNLLDNLNKTSLTLDLVKNEFASLNNTQFIERRVYEEDETLPLNEEKPDNVDSKQCNEESRISDMKAAVLLGISTVEKYFDKVEVPASDSEDETDFPSFVLKPKDPYMDRPLPYVIGSDAWYKKSHVGLEESSSDSEEEKASEKFSDSESDDDFPVFNKTKTQKTSNSGSDADLSNKINVNYPVANSTFNDSIRQPDMFVSNSSDDYNSVPAQAPIGDRTFAQQLAAKLGNVINNSIPVVESEINTKPIQRSSGDRIIGNLFSDEPPPLDDDDDEIYGISNGKQGLFSSGGGLFDDLEDDSESFWGEKKDKNVQKPLAPNLFVDDIKSSSSKSQNTPQQNLQAKQDFAGLFDEDGSDDDLFSTKAANNQPYKSFLPSSNVTSLPFFDDEPPDLFPQKPVVKEDPTTKKKPTGGVSVMGGVDIFQTHKISDLLKARRQDSSDSAYENVSVDAKDNISSLVQKRVPEKTTKPNDSVSTTKEHTLKRVEEKSGVLEPAPVAKKVSLFDDDDDDQNLFEDDLFSNITTKKFTSSLFDDDSPSLGSEHYLFSGLKSEKPEPKPGVIPTQIDSSIGKISKVFKTATATTSKPQVLNLFDNDDYEDDDDLFSTKSMQASKVLEPPKVDFDSNGKENTLKPVDLFTNDDDSFVPVVPDIRGEVKGNYEENSQDDTENFSKSVNKPRKVSIFDTNPPDLDDDWDTKSVENLFDDNETSSIYDHNSGGDGFRTSLFDNEPPSLLFNESSGIVRDGSNRLEGDESSFTPYASSSKRLSSDTFNEQHSNDSLFLPKNRSRLEPSNVNSSNLRNVEENIPSTISEVSESILNITPSGKIHDLFNSDSTLNNSVFGTSVPKTDVEEKIHGPKEDVEQEVKKNEDKEQISRHDIGVPDLLSDSIPYSLVKNVISKNSNSRTTETGNIIEEEKILKDTGVAQESVKTPETDTSVVAKPQVLTKPSAKMSKSTTNLAEAKEVIQQEKPKGGSPGKLKHNLNINVNALVPGAAPPKPRSLEKTHSLEATFSDEESGTAKPIYPTFTHSKSSGDISKSIRTKEELLSSKPTIKDRPVSFEDPVDSTETLHNFTKDRVKIPVKRRPSTRRARQELLRKSGTDFKLQLSPEEITVQSGVEKEIQSFKDDMKKTGEENGFASNAKKSREEIVPVSKDVLASAVKQPQEKIPPLPKDEWDIDLGKSHEAIAPITKNVLSGSIKSPGKEISKKVGEDIPALSKDVLASTVKQPHEKNASLSKDEREIDSGTSREAIAPLTKIISSGCMKPPSEEIAKKISKDIPVLSKDVLASAVKEYHDDIPPFPRNIQNTRDENVSTAIVNFNDMFNDTDPLEDGLFSFNRKPNNFTETEKNKSGNDGEKRQVLKKPDSLKINLDSSLPAKTNSLFDSPEFNNDLFAPISTKHMSVKLKAEPENAIGVISKESLPFESPDADDHLFATVAMKKPPASSESFPKIEKEKPESTTKIVPSLKINPETLASLKTSSIFDSSESDDHLFAPISSKILQALASTTQDSKSDSSLFDGDDARLFEEKSSKPVVNSDTFESQDFKESKLFEETDDLDDMFSVKKLPPKSNILKKSLFDDLDEDEDDIFATQAKLEKGVDQRASARSKVAPQKKVPKTSTLKKLGNDEVVDDPLNVFKE